ncbi:MAG: phosphodiester glycosidase family protein [Pseudomonadota bacterium]
MSDRKSSKRSCLSNFVGLALIVGMIVALLMFGFSLRDLFSHDQDSTQEQISQLATPTLRPTSVPPTLTPTNLPPASPTIQPTVPSVPSPTQTPAADSGWRLLQPGLESRSISIFDQETGRQLEKLTIVRLEPTQFNFDVGYSPGRPKTLDSWQQESQALLVVNAGYFTAEYLATGLTISDGQAFGSSYGPFAGMVSVSGNEPSSNVDVRWLRQAPYSPAENLWGAFQSFPILVHSGGTAAFPAESDNGDRSRRTAIGKDSNGRILILVSSQGWFTLSELSSWLAQSDLDLQLAINLDGGTSTGLIMAHPEQPVQLLPFSLLPTVLLVSPK